MKERYEHKKTYIVFYVKDKYELPIISTHSLNEVAHFIGVPYATVKDAIARKQVVRGLFKILRLSIDENNVYCQKGYADRKDYLNWLSDFYKVSYLTVETFAKFLGESEDFNKLVEMIKEIAKC